jgi:hypothetical protein
MSTVAAQLTTRESGRRGIIDEWGKGIFDGDEGAFHSTHKADILDILLNRDGLEAA